jgi:hypothetical protein
MHDKAEVPASQMPWIGPAFQLKRLGFIGVLAVGRGRVGLQPSAQTRRSIIAFSPDGA